MSSTYDTLVEMELRGEGHESTCPRNADGSINYRALHEIHFGVEDDWRRPDEDDYYHYAPPKAPAPVPARRPPLAA